MYSSGGSKVTLQYNTLFNVFLRWNNSHPPNKLRRLGTMFV